MKKKTTSLQTNQKSPILVLIFFKGRFAENWLLHLPESLNRLFSIEVSFTFPSRSWAWLSVLNVMYNHFSSLLQKCHLLLNAFHVFCFMDQSSCRHSPPVPLIREAPLPRHPQGDSGICRTHLTSGYWITGRASNVRAKKTERPTCRTEWPQCPSCSQGVSLHVCQRPFHHKPCWHHTVLNT